MNSPRPTWHPMHTRGHRLSCTSHTSSFHHAVLILLRVCRAQAQTLPRNSYPRGRRTPHSSCRSPSAGRRGASPGRRDASMCIRTLRTCPNPCAELGRQSTSHSPSTPRLRPAPRRSMRCPASPEGQQHAVEDIGPPGEERDVRLEGHDDHAGARWQGTAYEDEAEREVEAYG